MGHQILGDRGEGEATRKTVEPEAQSEPKEGAVGKRKDCARGHDRAEEDHEGEEEADQAAEGAGGEADEEEAQKGRKDQGYESLQLHHLSLMAALLPRFINLADIVISKS